MSKKVIYTIEHVYKNEDDFICNTEYLVEYVEGLIPNAKVYVEVKQKVL